MNTLTHLDRIEAEPPEGVAVPARLDEGGR